MADKLQLYREGRADGMRLAKRIVDEEGVEALAKEIGFREKCNIHMSLTSKELDAAAEQIKVVSISTLKVACVAVLHDEFGFGETRIKRFLESFDKLNEYLGKGWIVWMDLIDEIAGRLNIKLSVPEHAMIPETYRRPLEQDVWDEADLIPESDWKQLLRDLKYTEVQDGEKMVVVSDDKKDAWEYENKYQRITLYDHLNGILWERNRQKTAS